MPSTNDYYDIPKQKDGSIEIWCGPDKPADVVDAALIKTIPGRNFLVTLRLYGAVDDSMIRHGSRTTWAKCGNLVA
ncbi:DUF1214 domain-containing protein [Achromobacter sp. ACM02]|uniref:DUF1214 domain-containing protein n=1 Tax=Achromobacter sp. ACM02 TaxID=2769305 RepID=UPI001CE1D7DD|nr:DUF1214 domain-containing protein [Achromobacter sp. ACM02]